MKRSLPVLLLALVFGCAHEEKKPESTPVAAAAPQAAPTAAPSDPSPAPSKTDEAALQCGSVRVHFPFNSDDLGPDDRAQLERNAECLRQQRGMHVTIEGNADERGTEAYNLALGDRRAQSVATYLKSLGASAKQLKTVSYGKEYPLCTEHDEACWAKNRSAAVKPTSSH